MSRVKSVAAAPLRSGYTLVELVIAMSVGTVLVVGLTSVLFISAESFRGEQGARTRSLASQVQADLLNDVQLATSFTTKTSTSLEFTVPDRDGDDAEETITYDWDSVAKTLTYSYNGSATTTLLEDVTACDFNYLTRTFTGTYGTLPAIDTSVWGDRFGGEVVYEGFAESASANNGGAAVKSAYCYIPTPTDTVDGDLLVAATVVGSGGHAKDLQTYGISGWNYIGSGESGATFGVWWKIASSEPAIQSCYWGGHYHVSYGWIMRFTGHDPKNPIVARAMELIKEEEFPPSPSVTTKIDNALILRLGGFDKDSISADAPGLAGHTAITMDSDPTGTVSGGAGYVVQETAGDSGKSTFQLTDDEDDSVTVTIAIAPK